MEKYLGHIKNVTNLYVVKTERWNGKLSSKKEIMANKEILGICKKYESKLTITSLLKKEKYTHVFEYKWDSTVKIGKEVIVKY